MRVEIDAIASDGVAEEDFRSQTRSSDTGILQKLGALEERRVQRHWRNLSGFALLLRSQCINHGIQVAFHDAIELMQRESDTMVRYAVLREVVSADLLAAVAAAHHAATFRADLLALLLQLQFVQPRTQHPLCL